VVDDSALARDLISRGLGLDPGIDVIGQASDVYDARDKIVRLSPDVLTLDVEMPGMDGIEFLRRLMPQYPLPVVVVSAFTAEGSRHALEALEAGAVDVVGKPSGGDPHGLRDMLLELAGKVKLAASIDPKKLGLRDGGLAKENPPGTKPVAKAAAPGKAAFAMDGREEEMACLVAIGASTGGVAALSRIVTGLPASSPPVLIVQHMPPVFTKLFAQSLDKAAAMEVREAADGDRLRPGLALIGAGDLHLRVLRDQKGFLVRCEEGAKVAGHRPSVDVLFNSVAAAAGARAIGLLLTGMGRDGADGLLEMRRHGARCLAQDEESSVVFGMPQEAWRSGAAERLVPLECCAAEITALAAAFRRREGMPWG
jgi:two-component system chemotaxis response regulator CheB